MNKFCIYKVTNLKNSKSYIGFATSLEKRKNIHYCEAFSRQSTFVLHKALRKHGKDNFSWEILERGNQGKKLMRRESYYIKFYNTHYKNGYGYNMTLGGDGILGYKFTDSQINKLRLSHMGKSISEETRIKMSKSHKNKKNTIEHNLNIANAFSKIWEVVDPNGDTSVIKNLKSFCMNNNLRYTAMWKIANGHMKSHRGFSCRRIAE